MKLVKWDELPENMKNEEVRYYYDILMKNKNSIFFKRFFDVLLSIILIVILSPVMLIISVMIKLDSNGPVLFKQERVTQYGMKFKIFKFRTMVVNAEQLGTQVTVKNDSRVTTIGKSLRKYRLDELPQIFNIFKGELSFVGTRPEVYKYVKRYSEDMMATLLLPAGVTSEASINFKDEEKMLDMSLNIDNDYVEKVLPLKMKHNLDYLKKFNYFYDIKVMIKTLIAVVS
ncbi:MAG: sugar transferase [Clostridium sp.]|nr:sugar transferase [Clostridium sp.]MDU7084329.1 sugar transferase [Clostridium sp.]